MYIECNSFAAAAAKVPLLAPRRASDGKDAIAGYDPESVWTKLNKIGYNDDKICRFLVFPFDQRFIYYETGTKLLNRPRPEFDNNREHNEFFLTVPEPRKETETRPIFATTLANLHVHERGSVVFPRETRSHDLLSYPHANIGEATRRILSKHYGLSGLRPEDNPPILFG